MSGGRLVLLTSANRQVLAAAVGVASTTFYYVDGNDMAHEGAWLRNNNTEVMLVSDPLWAAGQPDGGSTANCGALWSGGFDDVQCVYHDSLGGGVICEQE